MADPQHLVLERSATFPAEPGSAGSARRLLREALLGAGREDWLESGELALSEVVTNAILHARTPITVTVQVHPASAEVQVFDRSPAIPLARAYDDQATTGRGMGLVAALASDCGVRQAGPDGKTVWFRLTDDGSSAVPATADDLMAAWDLDDASPHDPWQVPPGSRTREVVLRDMPATLWLAARQHHDALLRELVLYHAEHPATRVDLSGADVARNLVLLALVRAVEQAARDGSATTPLPPGHPSPLPAVPPRLDLVLQVPVDLGPAYAELQDALDLAESLSADGRLLVRPGLAEVVAVRDWLCEQVIAQLAGAPASPWPGTADQRFETPSGNGSGLHRDWDVASVLDSERGVVAADDTNRIVAVSRPLAALLGWEVQDLIGRRVVTLIPPRLREAHVAGFSRHLSTGEAHVLGVPLRLPALTADGRELACDYLVERLPVPGSRSIYVAWIEPAAD